MTTTVIPPVPMPAVSGVSPWRSTVRVTIDVTLATDEPDAPEGIDNPQGLTGPEISVLRDVVPGLWAAAPAEVRRVTVHAVEELRRWSVVEQPAPEGAMF